MSSDYIFGIHDIGGEELLRAARKTGWIVFSEVLGHDPNDHIGKDYSSFSRQGLGVIVRLNNGYHPRGTLPLSSEYANFASRCANFVAASKGCNRWIIGNEMNYAVERPRSAAPLAARTLGTDTLAGDPTLRALPERFSALLGVTDREGAVDAANGEELITPQLYANCYGMCRQAIKNSKGHDQDEVLLGAVAPWNNQTVYPGNPSGDWIKYFQDILLQCGASGCDGITLHTYTNGSNPTLILDNSKAPGFPQRHCHFQAYRDFMQAIPVNMRQLPVYITETDQGGPWENANRGWVQAAYAEIDRWNRQNMQQIQALVLYRWPQLDRWHIKGKANVIEDFRLALRREYRWNKEKAQPQPVEQPDNERQPESQPESKSETLFERKSERKSETLFESKSETLFERKSETLPESKSGTQYGRTFNRTVPVLQQDDAAENTDSDQGMVFGVQWLKGKPPGELHVGQHVRFPVTVRNTGTIAWSATGSQQIALGYHFFQNREKLPPADGSPLLTPLPRDVAPGETVTFDANMVIPERSGNYTLILDLNSGGENWFQDMQSDILTRWLHVSEAPGTAQAVPVEDGHKTQEEKETEVASVPETLPEPDARAEKRSPAAPVGPAIVDIGRSLPRGDHPFARRTPDQIRRLVICHTAAPPGVPIQAIAQAHISQGYPGIAYHYFVLETGEVLQVSELEAVVNDEAEWSLSGVNICLEGNFDEEAPPLAQLTAAAQLSAWLLPRFQLTAQSVDGLCALLETSSPGFTFTGGPAWEQTLHEKIVEFLADSPLSPPEEVAEEDKTPVAEDSPTALQPENVAAPRPPIEDVITRLPRDPQRLVQRQAEDVEFIVINHTAAPPITPLQTIAAAFHRRLPGILYQFFIASNGAIYQTQPMMQVVDGAVPYIARAVNIGLAGEFDDDIPTLAQIRSARQLIVWLMEEFPQLTLAGIRGVGEFINHTSPGKQWLQGRRWKDILLDAVREELDSLASPNVKNTSEMSPVPPSHSKPGASPTPGPQVDELHREGEQLPQEIAQGTEQPNRRRQVERPPIRDIIFELPRHPKLRYSNRSLDEISYVAIHHTALPAFIGPERIALAHVDENLSRGKRAWPGIGYHYFIPEDGELLQTQPLEKRSYHVGRHNNYSTGVVFAGNFMDGYLPTSYQIQSGARLVAWLLQEYQVPIANVLGHREFSENYTACPGSEWLEGGRWRDLLVAEIERIQNERPPNHYILFPTAGEMAKTMAEANDYFDRFQPEAGTRLEDALQARYVTLIGSGAGQTAANERRLEEAGVKIDRLDDSDAMPATQKLLRLAHDGHRFRSPLES